MRRKIVITLVALLIVAGLGSAAAVAIGGGSTVTRARLERALPVAFANLYVKQTHISGRSDVTTGSLQAKAMCDKHGPDVPDVGPGADWICLMSWKDPSVPMPTEGYGKFDVNVHSNDCFTAAGQTKLTGFLTMTDTHGNEVINPLFEFDSCFDPNGDNAATGVHFPSVFNITTTSVTPDDQSKVAVKVTCGTGTDGCTGTAVATANGVRLGTVPFRHQEEVTAPLTFPGPVPPAASEIKVEVKMTDGVPGSSSGSFTIPIQPR